MILRTYIMRTSLTISNDGSGKVKLGQRVLLKFESYPYQEYGAVEGTVKVKAKVPQGEVFAIEVELPDRLITNFNKELQFEQEMVGIAEIITEDKRFAERIFEKLLAMFKNA